MLLLLDCTVNRPSFYRLLLLLLLLPVIITTSGLLLTSTQFGFQGRNPLLKLIYLQNVFGLTLVKLHVLYFQLLGFLLFFRKPLIKTLTLLLKGLDSVFGRPVVNDLGGATSFIVKFLLLQRGLKFLHSSLQGCVFAFEFLQSICLVEIAAMIGGGSSVPQSTRLEVGQATIQVACKQLEALDSAYDGVVIVGLRVLGSRCRLKVVVVATRAPGQ